MGWLGGDINMPAQKSYGESLRDAMQAQIDCAANVDALEALYAYTETDGVRSRPLGEWPVDPNGE